MASKFAAEVSGLGLVSAPLEQVETASDPWLLIPEIVQGVGCHGDGRLLDG